MSRPSRRQFLKAASAGAALAAAGAATAAPETPAKLPQKVLGKTGVSVPAVGLGTAPGGHLPQKEAVALYHACLAPRLRLRNHVSGLCPRVGQLPRRSELIVRLGTPVRLLSRLGPPEPRRSERRV